MKAIRYILPTLFISFLALSPASALPGTPMNLMQALESSESSVIQVQARRDRGVRKGRAMQRGPGARGQRFTPGGRYRNAPAGWRRHGARPGNWRTQGCIMVGPVWFCP